MLCKFPDKACIDRYLSGKGSKDGYTQRKFCRLVEWKKKIGACPYDKTIRSRSACLIMPKKFIKKNKEDMVLGDFE